jgi:hypothetical protein
MQSNQKDNMKKSQNMKNLKKTIVNIFSILV